MLTLKQMSEILKLSTPEVDVMINSVGIDSRSIQRDALFIAIKGARFDGHDFVNEAVKQGAIAVMIEQKIETTVPVLLVPNTLSALGQLAANYRQHFSIPVLAVTGSCGKTTTKAMMASILAGSGSVLSPQASFNNNIGLPLTLLQLKKEHRYAVVEIGANHVGEISQLTQMAKPTIAAVANIGPVHLEGFGDLDGVAKAKSEIFEGLGEKGVAIINEDDNYAAYFKKRAQDKRIITFGMSSHAMVQARAIEMDKQGCARFILQIENTHVPIQLPMLGKHHVMNALAASAATYAAGIPIPTIKEGLENVPPIAKRLIKRLGMEGAHIIDDTYNANLPAAQAALHVLAQTQGEKLFVFGGMAELGEVSEAHHAKLGQYARSLEIDRLFATGPYSDSTVKAFGNGGQYFSDKQQMIAEIHKILNPNLTILVKGSRSTHMEEVVEAIVKENENRK